MRIALSPVAVAAAALLTAGTATAATAATTAIPAHHHDDVIWGTVVSGPDLKVRDEPSTHGEILAKLPPGSQDRVKCAVSGMTVRGDPHWYWLEGVRGWVSAAYVDTGGHHVPACPSADPCPQWRDRDCHQDPCDHHNH
ncbi:SH3 domain-containing protein [Streptomyces sp. NPDC058308]|uniref:SH3 domain-containing protein n=1 Tax=Streptomyces sp. NPDC058308 TaxID=3346440 RepID=UPI0036E35A55